MKRIAVLTVIGLWSGVLIYGAVGSSAWFTDTEVIPVSASAAHLAIEVVKDDGSVADSEDGQVAITHEMLGMVPGVLTSDQTFAAKVVNTGDLPVKVRLDAVHTGGSSGIFDDMLFWAMSPNVCQDEDSGGSVLYGGLLPGLPVTLPGTLAPGGEMCLAFEFMLAETATNSGGSTTFDLVFTAGQTNDPGF